MFSEETLYAVALRHCPLVGDMVFRKLVSEAGSAKEVWELSKSGLHNIHGIGRRISAEIGNDVHLKFAEKELQFCFKNNIAIRLRHLGELPALLHQCEDAPAILYQKGGETQTAHHVSIVGTRNLTMYGKTFIHEFLSEIAHAGASTVSGLALGADTEVHVRSLAENIPTIGVLAHGFHTFYPSKNRRLAQKILEAGGTLYTEFNSSQKPDRENFIQRNRIIAGLSAATIVVETAFGGGSVSTATFANGYNREVYALPGAIYEKYSQGCNHLIAQNKAAIISTTTSLINALGFLRAARTGDLFPSSEIRVQLTEIQQAICEALDRRKPHGLDDLCEKLDAPSHEILPELLHLELLNIIRTLSGRQYLLL